MRIISFNKKEPTSVCLFCKKNPVPMSKWNLRCDECKKKWLSENRKEIEISLVRREPAAIIETEEEATEIVVDKFGREVKDVEYDTKNDPHAWIKNGKQKLNPTAIL